MPRSLHLALRSSRIFTLAATLSLAVISTAQNLPAGTRSADSPSAQDATSTQLQSAESALGHGDYTAALAALQPLAAARPHDAHILYDLGFAYEHRAHAGDDAAAAAAYNQAIAAAPAFPEPRLALGLLDARTGHLDTAHRDLETVSQLPSASPDLRARALRSLAVLDETAAPDAARDQLLAALKLSPETPADILLSARLAERASAMPEAEAAYRRLLAATPDDPEATAGLAHTLAAQGKTADAEATLTAALKTRPGDPRLLSQLAAVYGAQGKPQQAIPLIEALHSSDPAVVRLLAHLYSLSGDNAKAEPLYRQLVAQNPADPTLLDDLATVLVEQQNFAEAQTLLSKAVSLRSAFPSPDAWADAAGHLAFAASRNHDPHLTLQALAARATVLPNSAASLFLEATAHDTLHQTQEAEKAYRAFLAAANGKFPDQEFQARHRLIALEHQR